MNRSGKSACVLLLFLFAGCSHIPFLGQPSRSSQETAESVALEPSLGANNLVKKGRVIDAPRLQQGGNIVAIPFKAGVGVEANQELDRIALTIVKGIADALEDDRESRFNILTAEDPQIADFIIQGHITKSDGPSRVRRWMLLKGQKTLGITGKVIDAQSGEAVAVFSDTAKTKEEDFKGLGYHVGKNIGLFVLSGAE